jgi:N-acetylglucosaminyl-diphospho-decaprenol L-rhamnosyltransferase
MTAPALTDVSCIVVHHRNFPTVLGAVDALVAAGVQREALLVVDNSEAPALTAALEQALPADVALITVANGGYGHAVNRGLDHLAATGAVRTYTLVATHEVEPRTDALAHLRNALRDDPTTGVAGPSLIDSAGGGATFWSLGGELTRVLNHPKHVGWGSSVNAALPSQPQPRAWIDGACCLYVSSLFDAMRFREDLFLYFEENDLHRRICATGYGVVWVPQAFVGQSSAGVPPYLFGRNLQLFQATHGTRLQRRVSVPMMIARSATRRALRRGTRGEVRAMYRGWRHGLRPWP